MRKKCDVCSEDFDTRNALCEDWNDPARSIGCPTCGTFYVQVLDEHRSESWMKNLWVGLGVTVMMNFIYSLMGNDVTVIAFFQILILSGMIAAKSPRVLGKLEASGLPRKPDNEAEDGGT